MTTHDELRLRLGSYATGSLTPVEKAETESHIAACGSCRSELLQLSPVIAAYLRAPLQTLDEADAPNESANAQRLAEAASETIKRRSFRKKAWTASLASGLVLLLALATAVVTLGSSSSTSPRTFTLHSVTTPTGFATTAKGTVELEKKAWGTQLVLTISHLPTQNRFVASVFSSTGTQIVGGWNSTPDGHVVVKLATALSPAVVKKLTIADSSGAVIMTS